MESRHTFDMSMPNVNELTKAKQLLQNSANDFLRCVPGANSLWENELFISMLQGRIVEDTRRVRSAATFVQQKQLFSNL
jgi:hypothetical protein